MSSPSATCQFASTAGTVYSFATKSTASLHRRPGFVVFLFTLNPVPVTLWYRICKSWRAPPFSVPGAAGNELRQALQRHRISGQLLVPFPHFPPLIAIRGCLESDRNPAPGRPGRQLARGGSSDAEYSQGPGSLAKGPEDFPRLEANYTKSLSMQARNTALGLGTRMKARGPSCKELGINPCPHPSILRPCV